MTVMQETQLKRRDKNDSDAGDTTTTENTKTDKK